MGQSSTPFMKLNNKKSKKAVSFDTMDVLERNSENMERMTGLLDKMYIKLDQKMYCIIHRYIKGEEEVKIGKI